MSSDKSTTITDTTEVFDKENINNHALYSKYDLDKQIIALLTQEPYFAALSRMVDKRPSVSIPTAGVMFNKHSMQFEMLYNPNFFFGLTNKERLAVIKHELYHLIFLHVTTRNRTDGDPVKHKIWNFATDLAINSFINDLPEMCLKAGKDMFADYTPHLAAEAYYSKLLGEVKDFINSLGKGKSGQQFDSHEGWANSGNNNGQGEENGNGGSGISEDIQKERLDELMKKAYNEISSNGKGWGTVHTDVQKAIQSHMNGFVNWKNVLRYFIKQSLKADKSSSVKKINKRYPFVHPGKKVIRTANIAIAIDQSGSVSDDLLSKFFTELNSLSKLATFTVLPFDTEVVKDKIFVWKKGQKVKTERVSCGGTDFQSVTNYFNEQGKWDGLLMLTDLCAPKPGPVRGARRIWLADETNAKNPYFSTNEIILSIK